MNLKTHPKKVLIAAGGTGGHVFPGIAITEEIKRTHPDTEITFVGTARGLEATLIPRMGIKIALVKSYSIKDRGGFSKILAFVRLPVVMISALRLVLKERPSIVVSIGGYAAGPVSLAAWMLGIPVVIVEPNAIAGFTNKILGKIAKRVFIAFDEAISYFPISKTLVTGNPVRDQVIQVKKDGPYTSDKLTIFVFGGSQGAVKLNRAMVSSLQSLEKYRDKIEVIHQIGINDSADIIRHAYEEAGIKARVSVFIEKIWEAYKEADIVVSRSGAITVAELLVLGIPAILVPYPFAADDHQRANAASVVAIGGAIAIADADFSGKRLAQEIKNLIEWPEKLNAMRRALKVAGRPDAKERIVEECWKIMKD